MKYTILIIILVYNATKTTKMYFLRYSIERQRDEETTLVCTKLYQPLPSQTSRYTVLLIELEGRIRRFSGRDHQNWVL